MELSDNLNEQRADENESNLLNSESLTIIGALDVVQEIARGSGLSEEFWINCKNEFDYLCDRLDINRIQAVVLAIMCEIGEPVIWKDLSDFMGISRLKLMSFTSELEDLKKRRWISSCIIHKNRSGYEGVRLTYGIIKAFRKNIKFEPICIKNLNEQRFVELVRQEVSNDCPTEEINKMLLLLLESNPHLPLYEKAMELMSESSRIILLYAIADYAQWCKFEYKGLSLMEICGKFDDFFISSSLNRDLKEGSHELLEKGILEYSIQEEGLADPEIFRLTKQAREKMLGEFELYSKVPKASGKIHDRDLLLVKDIHPKTLFYNADVSIQIDRLRNILLEDTLKNIQERLQSKGLRRGITCLFYGSPGTGKTETVFQLAKDSGRDILFVDISQLRDKFVGESEKNIKEVFNRYRSLCEGKDTIPILFFNEADAVINTRFSELSSSVDKMENTIQNIILQELENFEGIMLATTNLTGTLDQAFDRRFLFKVEFPKPDKEVKYAIWKSLVSDLCDMDYKILASEFDLSGGQIENISRKCMIEYALYGKPITLLQVKTYCREELINRSTHNKIGF